MTTRNEQEERDARTAKAEVEAEFDRHLASLRMPDFRQRVEAVMAARGRGKHRPKAGPSF